MTSLLRAFALVAIFTLVLGSGAHAVSAQVGGGNNNTTGVGGGNNNTTGVGGGNNTNTGVGGGNNNTTGVGGGNSNANCGEGGDQVLVNPLKVCSIEDLLKIILEAVVQIGTIVLVLMLVWVGFLFVRAQGKPEKITEARNALIWTIIGGLILLGAEALSEVVKETVNTL